MITDSMGFFLKPSLSENHALQGKKFMKMGLTVANSVNQTQKSSVYQTIQFAKHYSTTKSHGQARGQSAKDRQNFESSSI